MSEFAAMVDGTHPDVQKYREYVLAELRCARRRAQLLVVEIETIGVALRGDFIDPDGAIEWLRDANALDFLQPAEPEWTRDEPKADVAS
jgi:hypothetical protein